MISQGTDTKTVGYPGRGRLAAISAPLGHQLALYFARAFYTGVASNPPAGDVGVLRLLSQSSCKLFGFDNTDYSEISLPLAGPTEIVSDAAAGTGFVVQAKREFGIIGLDISVQDAQALTVKYWNGSSFVALTAIEALDLSATGVSYLVFLPPADWVPGGDGDLDSNMYSIQVTAAVAPTAAIVADDIWVASWIEYYSALSAGQSVAVKFDAEKPLILDSDEGIMPYFEEAADNNGITVAFSTF